MDKQWTNLSSSPAKGGPNSGETLDASRHQESSPVQRNTEAGSEVSAYETEEEDEAMRFIFKIAAGVFIGIIGVLVVLAIPRWREHSRAADAVRIMELLTPEQVMSRCGKPASDDIAEVGGGIRLRSMVYDGPSTAVLNFSTGGAVSHWLFMGMGIGVNGETRAVTKIEFPVEQLRWLPCLAAK